MSVKFQEVDSLAWQQYHIDLSTTQLLQPVGSAIEAALGLMKDYFADRVRASIKTKFPSLASPEALANIGYERGLPQGPLESDASFAARLLDAWNAWVYAGTAFGLLRVFYLTGYTNVVLAQVTGGMQYTLGASGTTLLSSTHGSWTTGFGSFWSMFDVIFASPLPTSWQSGGIPSSSSAEANFIRTIISAWKPAHATCGRIIIETAGKLWGYPATQQWGAATGNWGGTTTVWIP